MAGKLIADILSNGITDKSMGAVLLDPGSVSLGKNGYQKLASGLIIQWGLTENLTATPLTVNFPISFPTECVGVWLNIYNTTATYTNEAALTVASKSVSKFSAVGKVYNSGSLNKPTFYIAIGY